MHRRALRVTVWDFGPRATGCTAVHKSGCASTPFNRTQPYVPMSMDVSHVIAGKWFRLVESKLCAHCFSHGRSSCRSAVVQPRNVLVRAARYPVLFLSPQASRYKLRHLANGSILARSIPPESWPKPRRLNCQVAAAGRMHAHLTF